MTVLLASIQVGRPRSFGRGDPADPWNVPWRSAIVKEQVAGPVRLGRTNLEGDAQADLRVHGGADKAVLAYAAAHYPVWRAELDLPDLAHGAFGENFTLAGIDETVAAIGDTWRIGTAMVQVSEPREPCVKLARRFRREDLPKRVLETGRSGWYLRVLEEGTVEADQELVLLERPYAALTIARAHAAGALATAEDLETASGLAACPLLSDGWRRWFARALEARRAAGERLTTG